jgi:hypothetical protein
MPKSRADAEQGIMVIILNRTERNSLMATATLPSGEVLGPFSKPVTDLAMVLFNRGILADTMLEFRHGSQYNLIGESLPVRCKLGALLVQRRYFNGKPEDGA